MFRTVRWLKVLCLELFTFKLSLRQLRHLSIVESPIVFEETDNTQAPVLEALGSSGRTRY